MSEQEKISLTDMAWMYASQSASEQLTELVHAIRVGIDPDLRQVDPIATSIAHSRAWNWTQAAKWLRLCYRAIGEESPFDSPEDEGYALHCGTHPIQMIVAAAEASN